ncbi:hypothetical protein [Clostridium kluyveri]|uniref:Uncharacterized protein n=1 Tax=Clostridium kluyveri TaxID=1534 RepID=A0A1L5F8Q9_CLOKL|nr:hypothetical protein [Clostridium kluyveri]APM39398.1 hypothetical protein BS101_11920 [Clostridium kluyveri]
MDNIYSLVYNTLIQLGYPVKEQGTYIDTSTLPETYITYFIVDNPTSSAYDNMLASQEPRIQVNIYSKKPSIKQSGDNLFKSVMLPAGFTRLGGRDLPFNPDTGHYCYSCDYRYYLIED